MEGPVPWGSLVVVGLAVWRLTRLLHAEAGPGDVLGAFRRRAAPTMLGGVVGCFFCLSLWISAPGAALIATGWRDGVVLWLALSAIAIGFETLINAGQPPAPFYEERLTGDDDGVLRGREAKRHARPDDATRFTGAENRRAHRATESHDGVHRRQGADRRWASHR
jgi:hypothetical protein